MNTPESVHVNQTVNESLKSKTERYLLKAGTVGALGLLALTACSNTAESAPEDTNTTVIDAGKSDQEKTPEKTDIDPFTEWSNGLIEKSIELYDMPKPEKFDEYKAMTIEEFWALPIEDRIEYSSYLRRDAEINMEMFHFYTENPKDVMPDSFHANNTAEEISVSMRSLIRDSITSHFEWLASSDSNYETVTYDSLDRQKILAAGFLIPNNSQVFTNWNTPVAEDRGSNERPEIYAAHGQLLADEDTFDESDNYTITDQWGTQRIARDIKIVEADGETFTGTMVLIETTSASQWINLR